MIVGIADTHAALWYVFQDSRLSNTAKQFIDHAVMNGDEIGISPITLVELIYLIEKGRIPAESFSRLAREMADRDSGLVEVELNTSMIRSLSLVESVKVPDMPDRIIAATAVYYRVPVLSRDSKIQISGIQTIW